MMGTENERSPAKPVTEGNESETLRARPQSDWLKRKAAHPLTGWVALQTDLQKQTAVETK